MFKIMSSAIVKGCFEAYDHETGAFFAPKGRVVYPTERGLKIALARAGESYDSPPKAEKSEAEKLSTLLIL